jgi:hypothetical protein
MAEKTIAQFDAFTAITTDDVVPMYDTGTSATKKITFDNLQKSITVVGGAAGVSAQGDVKIPLTSTFYIGPSDADGSFAITISAGNLSFQKRIGGSWVEVGNVGA